MLRIVLTALLVSGSFTSWDFQGIYTGQNVRDIRVGDRRNQAATVERFVFRADGDEHVKVDDSDCPMRFRLRDRAEPRVYVLERKTCKTSKITVTFTSGQLTGTDLGHITMTWQGTFEANGRVGTIKATYVGRRINR